MNSAPALHSPIPSYPRLSTSSSISFFLFPLLILLLLLFVQTSPHSPPFSLFLLLPHPPLLSCGRKRPSFFSIDFLWPSIRTRGSIYALFLLFSTINKYFIAALFACSGLSALRASALVSGGIECRFVGADRCPVELPPLSRRTSKRCALGACGASPGQGVGQRRDRWSSPVGGWEPWGK